MSSIKKKSEVKVTPKCRTIDSYFTKKKKIVTVAKPKNLNQLFNSVARIEEGPLKGLPTTLLDKIKSKKIDDDDESQKVKMLEKLPEMVKIVHCFFLTNPKPVKMSVLIEKCISSYYTYISIPETEKQIRYICEIFPDWFTIITLRKIIYVKLLDKSKTINSMIEKIKNLQNSKQK
ncbi:uncharacterized protein LOC128386531 [Panonychus citri]|uniref:uncharacterized protein LOC128386531 n=1 Tax=Panonychus citri TaxID=50023 RepID=UPI002306F471|nr:uncharacterized protein LOC128386531 [Panonychus citri]